MDKNLHIYEVQYIITRHKINVLKNGNQMQFELSHQNICPYWCVCVFVCHKFQRIMLIQPQKAKPKSVW